jgi:hypothetical protein
VINIDASENAAGTRAPNPGLDDLIIAQPETQFDATDPVRLTLQVSDNNGAVMVHSASSAYKQVDQIHCDLATTIEENLHLSTFAGSRNKYEYNANCVNERQANVLGSKYKYVDKMKRIEKKLCITRSKVAKLSLKCQISAMENRIEEARLQVIAAASQKCELDKPYVVMHSDDTALPNEGKFSVESPDELVKKAHEEGEIPEPQIGIAVARNTERKPERKDAIQTKRASGTAKLKRSIVQHDVIKQTLKSRLDEIEQRIEEARQKINATKSAKGEGVAPNPVSFLMTPEEKDEGLHESETPKETRTSES